MSTLQEWIIHRAKIVRLAWPDGVADASGVAPAMLDSIAVSGNLRRVGRGSRGFLARALKVSVRELEALAAGRIDWIADERLIDLDRRSPNAVRSTSTPVAFESFACPARLGIPIVGRIMEMGRIEHYDNWTPEDGPRLALRFAGLPDAFALKLEMKLLTYRAGECLVFHPILPGEIQDGEIVLLTRGDGEGENELCILHREAGSSFRVELTECGSGEASAIELVEILRSARVVGSEKRIEDRE